MASLFDDDIPLNRSVPIAARPRLSKQCREILDRLRQGRASNTTLAGISLKYTGRLSEVRKAGFDVRVVSHDHKTGYVVYALFENGREVG